MSPTPAPTQGPFSAEGLSLWWIPPAPQHEALQGVIDQLARAHGAPRFEPHVTLLGRLVGEVDVIVEVAASLAETIVPFEAHLTDYGHERAWTRWLYRHVAPTQPVMSAAAQARELFCRDDDRPYTPHLSLMYGEFADDVTRRIIGEDPAPAPSFVVDTLHVVSTDGPVDRWHRVASFPLVGGSRPITSRRLRSIIFPRTPITSASPQSTDVLAAGLENPVLALIPGSCDRP